MATTIAFPLHCTAICLRAISYYTPTAMYGALATCDPPTSLLQCTDACLLGQARDLRGDLSRALLSAFAIGQALPDRERYHLAECATRARMAEAFMAGRGLWGGSRRAVGKLPPFAADLCRVEKGSVWVLERFSPGAMWAREAASQG